MSWRARAGRLSRWVRSRRPVRVRGGLADSMRMDLRMASAWYADGENEAPVQLALRERLRPGDTLWDVGANVGFFTLIGARLVGESGRVVAFEAAPRVARVLRRNVALNSLGQASVIECAVGADDGFGAFSLASHPGGGSLGHAAARTGEIQVRVARADSLVQRAEAPAPSFVKLDVEGAELDALRGMVGVIRVHRPGLLIELDDEDAGRLEHKRAEIERFLGEHGYTCARLEDAYPDIGWHVMHLVAHALPGAPADAG